MVYLSHPKPSTVLYLVTKFCFYVRHSAIHLPGCANGTIAAPRDPADGPRCGQGHHSPTGSRRREPAARRGPPGPRARAVAGAGPRRRNGRTWAVAGAGPGRSQGPDLGGRRGRTWALDPEARARPGLGRRPPPDWAVAAAGLGGRGGRTRRSRRPGPGATRISGRQSPSKLIFRRPIFRPRCTREITDSNMPLAPHDRPAQQDEIRRGPATFSGACASVCWRVVNDLACWLGKFQSLIVVQL
jgi:hypothetical protein